MRFTADDAFELRGTDDAIILDQRAALKILAGHDADLAEFAEDFPAASLDAIDAGDILAFLGY